MRKVRKNPDEMTFLEHLEDLRKRLFWSFASIFIVIVPAYVFSKDIFRFLAQPIVPFLPNGINSLAFRTLTEPFMLYLKVSFLAALFVSSPFIFYQLWLFIAPGLYRKERKYVWPFVIFTTFFFLGGAAFSYYVAYPFACRFFINLGSEFQPMITVNDFFNLTVKMLLGVGLVFEMPTLIFFLARMGIVTAKWMIKNFKYAVLGVFVIAALITPSPDMVNQAILAVPMLGLYGISIVIAAVFGKKKKKAKDAAEPAG